MSTSVQGFKPPDAKWEAMKKVYDACTAADVTVPPEVWAFFDDEAPDETGVLVELDGEPCCREFSDDGKSGFEVDVTLLPKDVRYVRFTNSW